MVPQLSDVAGELTLEFLFERCSGWAKSETHPCFWMVQRKAEQSVDVTPRSGCGVTAEMLKLLQEQRAKSIAKGMAVGCSPDA